MHSQTVTDLVKSGKKAYDLEFVEFDQESSNNIQIAEAIHLISLNSIGDISLPEHMLSIYRGLGIEHLYYIEKDENEEAEYFYGKKIDPNLDIKPPLYPEFREALTNQRKREKRDEPPRG